MLSRSPLPSVLAGPPTFVTPLDSSTSYTRHPGGAHLCYTPMIHARVFSESKAEGKGGDSQFNKTCGEEGSAATVAGIEGGDRPLFVQVRPVHTIEDSLEAEEAVVLRERSGCAARCCEKGRRPM